MLLLIIQLRSMFPREIRVLMWNCHFEGHNRYIKEDVKLMVGYMNFKEIIRASDTNLGVKSFTSSSPLLTEDASDTQ